MAKRSSKGYRWFRSNDLRYMKIASSTKNCYKLNGKAGKFNGAGAGDDMSAGSIAYSWTDNRGFKRTRVYTRKNVSQNRYIRGVNKSRTFIDYNIDSADSTGVLFSKIISERKR